MSGNWFFAIPILALAFRLFPKFAEALTLAALLVTLFAALFIGLPLLGEMQ